MCILSDAFGEFIAQACEQPLIERVGKYENNDEILLKTPIGGRIGALYS